MNNSGINAPFKLNDQMLASCRLRLDVFGVWTEKRKFEKGQRARVSRHVHWEKTKGCIFIFCRFEFAF